MQVVDDFALSVNDGLLFPRVMSLVEKSRGFGSFAAANLEELRQVYLAIYLESNEVVSFKRTLSVHGSKEGYGFPGRSARFY